MVTIVLAAAIVFAVLCLGWTVGRHGALRADRIAGPWAWIAYTGLGAGMSFGAMSTIDVPLLSTFMWTKVCVFIATGLWLASRRGARGERLLPRLAL